MEGAANVLKLMEGPAAAQKVDGRSRGCKESQWKVSWMHGELIEVDGRYHRCTES